MSRRISNSLSTKRRRFLEEVENFFLSRNDTTEHQNQNIIVSNNIVVSDESRGSNLISDTLDFSSFTQCIKDNNINDSIIKLITKWTVTYNITNSALSAFNIPINAKTILKMNSDHSICPPRHIDGLPLTKSSCCTFWPILGCVQLFNSHYVFLIGIYWGYEKLQESNFFLKSFINELKELSINSIFTNVGQKHIIVSWFCCDAPAKSIYFQNRVCFPETKFTKRTHLDFLNRVDEEHHMTDKISLITEVPNIDIVNDFPLGYMHLVCLGLWLGHIKNSPLSVFYA
ncbi:Uncharacterized protein FWK35_00018514 [Aphis craccivora]|uniref:Uncharacterized protein n=1 Tax=Aphis craccivora TaxID=307492 RepID=A0A6G0XB48_APHCR|nr:Uncharacterized protein FWK35_00018514 [Aphis craccivora]